MKLLELLIRWITKTMIPPARPTPPPQKLESNYLWVIDNGHASTTPGKRSPVFPDGTQLLEYKFNREVAQKLCAMLHNEGLDYHLLVPEEHRDISLSERGQRANSLATPKKKILISIHGNAFGNGVDWTSATGVETYYCSGSKIGHSLAVIFQQHIKSVTGLKNRGSKSAGFYILKRTSMPAILTESGFFTNEKECLYMLSDEGTTAIANGHLSAIKETERLKLVC